jgi:WD40 repeat protein
VSPERERSVFPRPKPAKRLWRLQRVLTRTGSVLAVRWAHHGRFLASGSDDAVVMIWGLDP